MRQIKMANKLFYTFIAVFFLASASWAQTTSFTFQGKLNDGAIPANGNYLFEFKLFGANGNQIGQTLSDVSATVTNGIFAVNLDFGAESFDGSPRLLEIGVRQSGSGQNYTVLNPRQPITSTPYAVKSLKSEQANTAILANDATKLGNIPAAQYTQTNDPRLSDARTPTPFSAYYIQNGTSQQAASNFNVSGEGKANVLSANTQFNIGATRVLSTAGDFNIFVGANAGATNSNGYSNSFVGAFAGEKNTTGGFNSFFGRNAGQNNSDGNRNSFYGVNAGLSNTAGIENSFFGLEAGYGSKTGSGNAFFGTYAGRANTTGMLLAFFGMNAGLKNTSGEANSFFGGEAGMENTEGDYNSFFGFTSGKNNSTGFNNSLFGAFAGRGNTSGANNAFFGANAGLTNNGSLNSFYGSAAGLNNHTGSNNSFFGGTSGVNNTTGTYNTFVGASAGKDNFTGKNNTFIGASSGLGVNSSPTGDNNTAIGYNTSFAAGVNNSVAIGANITVNTSNTVKIGDGNDTVELSLLKVGKVTASFGTSTFPAIVSDLVTTDKLNANEIFTRELTFQFNGLNNEPSLPLCYVQIVFSYRLSPCQPNLQKTESEQTDGALANSVKKQQTQIETQAAENHRLQQQLKQQQTQIDALKSLVCQQNPTAIVCADRVKK